MLHSIYLGSRNLEQGTTSHLSWLASRKSKMDCDWFGQQHITWQVYKHYVQVNVKQYYPHNCLITQKQQNKCLTNDVRHLPRTWGSWGSFDFQLGFFDDIDSPELGKSNFQAITECTVSNVFFSLCARTLPRIQSSYLFTVVCWQANLDVLTGLYCTDIIISRCLRSPR